MTVADLRLSFSLLLLFTESHKSSPHPLINSVKCLSSLSCSPANISTSERRSCLKVIEEGGGRMDILSLEDVLNYTGRKIKKPEKNKSVFIIFNC